MRVPVSSSPHSHQHSPKPPTISTTNNTTIIRNINIAHITPTSCAYEPTSVLDLCRSPSPATVPDKPSDHSAVVDSLSKPAEESSLELDEHVLHSLDWDSIMKDLGLHDDSVATVFKTTTTTTTTTVPQPDPCEPQVPHLPDFPNSQEPPFDFSLSDYMNQNMGYNYTNNSFDHLVHDFNQNGNWNNGFDFIEELIRAADCFDTNQLQLAHVILDRLNQRLRSPLGKPLHRAAFYFKDALQSLLSGSNRTPRISSLVEIVQSIRAFKAFSGISPIPMFSIFTTNQALLEALHGSSFIHVIDFDIGIGIQYASLIKEIAEKADSCKINSPVLRISAVVPEEYAVESRLIRENLNQFAHELRIRVQIEFVPMRTFETLSLKAVKFMDGEKTAVLLSPTIFRHLGSTKNIAAFLGDIRRVSPSVVVFVDGEGWADAAAATSFRRGVVNSLEFYSMMLESLDASMMGGGGGGDWVRRIEMLLLRPKMLAAVEGGGRRVPAWRELFYGAGMRAVQLSQFADFQAECLLAKVQIRGFHVSKRQAELVLLWNERAMVSTSAWRC